MIFFFIFYWLHEGMCKYVYVCAYAWERNYLLFCTIENEVVTPPPAAAEKVFSKLLASTIFREQMDQFLLRYITFQLLSLNCG